MPNSEGAVSARHQRYLPCQTLQTKQGEVSACQDHYQSQRAEVAQVDRGEDRVCCLAQVARPKQPLLDGRDYVLTLGQAMEDLDDFN